MKKLHTIFLLSIWSLFFQLTLQATPPNLTIFSEDAQPFTVTLNGEKFNETPTSKVEIPNLTTGKYRLYITFTDTNLPPVARNIQIGGTELYTYAIRKSTSGEYFAHLYEKAIVKETSTATETSFSTEEEDNFEISDSSELENDTDFSTSTDNEYQEENNTEYSSDDEYQDEYGTDETADYAEYEEEETEKKGTIKGQFTLLTIKFGKGKKKKKKD